MREYGEKRPVLNESQAVWNKIWNKISQIKWYNLIKPQINILKVKFLNKMCFT